MLTLNDCIDFAGLTPEQVKAIAEHEKIPELVATCLANKLMETPNGRDGLRRLLEAELDFAMARGEEGLAQQYKRGLDAFGRYDN
ncbi:MAG: hypothetical protein NDJ90_03720 [Oligoflexia bacterium]|nr:hypothetical protein [Oligoflexia bacterium]